MKVGHAGHDQLPLICSFLHPFSTPSHTHDLIHLSTLQHPSRSPTRKPYLLAMHTHMGTRAWRDCGDLHLPFLFGRICLSWETLPRTLSLPDPAGTLPSTSLSLTRRGNPQWPRRASAWPRPRSLLHHLSLVALAWSPGRARHHPPRRRTRDATLDPPTLHRRCHAALSFRRTPGKPPAPSHPSSLSRSTTRTSLQTLAPSRSLATAPPRSTKRLLPPFLPVGARTWCTVHRPAPFK
jgi:hypothetical protein